MRGFYSMAAPGPGVVIAQFKKPARHGICREIAVMCKFLLKKEPFRYYRHTANGFVTWLPCNFNLKLSARCS